MEELRSLVSEVQRESQSVCEEIRSFTSSLRNLVLLFCGDLRGVARHLATVLTLATNTSITYMEGDYAYNTLLPYLERSEMGILLLAASESCLYRVASACSLLAVPTLVISTKIRDEVKRRIRNVKILELEHDIVLTVLHATLRIAAQSSEQRLKRLESELDLGTVVNEVVELYVQKLHSVARKESLLVYSYSMEPAVDTLPIEKQSMEREARANNVTILYASTEDPLAAEYAFRLRRTNPSTNIVFLRINTDPLTAPLYARIALLSALRSSARLIG